MNWTPKLLNNTAIQAVSEYDIDFVLITAVHISSCISSPIYKSDGAEGGMEDPRV